MNFLQTESGRLIPLHELRIDLVRPSGPRDVMAGRIPERDAELLMLIETYSKEPSDG